MPEYGEQNGLENHIALAYQYKETPSTASSPILFIQTPKFTPSSPVLTKYSTPNPDACSSVSSFHPTRDEIHRHHQTKIHHRRRRHRPPRLHLLLPHRQTTCRRLLRRRKWSPHREIHVGEAQTGLASAAQEKGHDVVPEQRVLPVQQRLLPRPGRYRRSEFRTHRHLEPAVWLLASCPSIRSGRFLLHTSSLMANRLLLAVGRHRYATNAISNR